MGAHVQERVEVRSRRVEPVDQLYLDLLRRCLTRMVAGETYRTINPQHRTWKRALYLAHLPVKRLLALGDLELVRRIDFDADGRAEGRDIPPTAETVIGLRRLENIESCIASVLRDDVPGDLIETGVWRGGATIFMRGVLKAYGVTDRVVWVADSFRGVPKPDGARFPQDAGAPFWRNAHLAVSAEEVAANFRRYGLLDEQVRFLEGWFQETLPSAPIERLALLRLDGDLYESTIVALEALYPKVSPGGFVIVDDYGGGAPGCARAVDDFRARQGITDELRRVDWNGAYWRVG